MLNHTSWYSGHIIFPYTFYQFQTTLILITTINLAFQLAFHFKFNLIVNKGWKWKMPYTQVGSIIKQMYFIVPKKRFNSHRKVKSYYMTMRVFKTNTIQKLQY